MVFRSYIYRKDFDFTRLIQRKVGATYSRQHTNNSTTSGGVQTTVEYTLGGEIEVQKLHVVSNNFSRKPLRIGFNVYIMVIQECYILQGIIVQRFAEHLFTQSRSQDLQLARQYLLSLVNIIVHSYHYTTYSLIVHFKMKLCKRTMHNIQVYNALCHY